MRRLRTEQRLSTRALAAAIDVSPGFVSQLENGLALPSVASLVKLAGALGVRIGDLFDAGQPASKVIRRDERPRYEYPDIGVTDEILSAGPQQELQVLAGHIAPGGGSGEELYTHGAVTEFVLVVSGEVELRLGDERIALGPGDSVTFSGDTPHGYFNRGSEPAEVIWAMTPGSY